MKGIYSSVIVSILFLTFISVSGLGCANGENNYYPRFEIISPKATIYHNSTVEIFAVVTKLTDEAYPMIDGIRYTLNDSNIFSYEFTNFTYNGLVNLPNNKTGHEYVGRATLEGLKEGNYTLNLSYGHGNNTIGSWWGSSVNFRVVYGDYEPSALLSPINQTYYSSEVPIDFSTNEDYVYAYYSLNGGKPVFIKPNTMMTNLQEGSNNLLVFIKFRDIHSDFKINFTVDSNPENLQNTCSEFILIGVAAISLVLIALTIFREIQRRKTKNSNRRLFPDNINHNFDSFSCNYGHKSNCNLQLA